MKKIFILSLLGVLFSLSSFAVSAIVGPSAVCVGNTATMTDSTTGGTWTSSNIAIATVGSTSGVVNGIAAGIATISYITGTGTVTKTITVNAPPTAISGSSTVCVGNVITLTDATTGGTWISGNTSLATVGSLTGVVTGVAPGVLNIYYSVGGCGTYKTVTVNAAPAPITGSSTLCVGSTITLSDTASGGSWTSANPAVATIGTTSGIVTGVAAGTTTIYYGAGGCITYKIVTVTASPAAISGSSSLCVGSTITLTDATGGGTWASSATTVATVGSSTGIVTGVAAGTSTIYYSVPGCGGAYKIVTVTAAPAAITGSSTVCVGSNITLADATPGGTWSSSSTSIAYVSSIGTVYGNSAGVATISYTVGGCGSVTTSVTVNAAPAAITGASTLCVGSTITLTDSVSGGTWSTSGTSVATIGSTTGIVTGVAAGTVNVYYLVGGCGAYKTLTVTATPAAISGSSTVCVGSTITLTDATTGGTWASSVSPVATVGSTTGIVTGVAAGTTTIYYSVPGCGGAYKIVTVTAAPAAITGSNTVCVGGNTTLADATPGGTWSSSSTSIAYVSSIGTVYGNSAGVATISYTVGGCGSVIHTVTVNPAPAAIAGPSTLCVGSTITLTDSVSGGTWSTSGTSIATIGSTTGIVTGVAAGTVNVYYLVGGCGAYKTLTVTASPAAISGSSTVCVGGSITLTDATAGGTWASAATSVATVDTTTGIVTGVAAGTTTIYYSVPGCGGAYKIVTVTTAPAPITGSSSVCVGSTITLTDATPGGTWSSSATSIAHTSVSIGAVVGVSPGVTTISYTVSGCGSVTTNVTVNAAPGPITGPTTLCVGSTVTLTDSVSGGIWTTSGTSVATIDTVTGVVTGVAAGTVHVYYLMGGCGTYKTLTVTASPAAISGSGTVCVGGSITLSDATAGGTWASAATSVATVGSGTGVVSGIAPGTTTIYYSVPGCGGAYKIVTVTAAPASITGSSSVCVGNNITLADATPGGTWSSSATSIAYVSASLGIVHGNAAGVATISYTVGGCGSVTKTITVNAVPSISGSGTICIGTPVTLTSSVGGGTWISSNTAHASVDSTTGIVTGVAAGTATIYYVGGGCGAYKIVTVSTCTGTIGGGISTGSPKGTSSAAPVVGMMVRLKYAATDAIVTQTYTDASGMYSFTGLADDEYYVYPEQAGYTTTPSATLTISGSSSIINNIDFKVYDGSKTITPIVTSVAQVTTGIIAIHPNPAVEELTISWKEQDMAGASVVIMDVTGREMRRATMNNSGMSGDFNVSVSDLADGIYVISVISDHINYRTEVLKTH